MIRCSRDIRRIELADIPLFQDVHPAAVLDVDEAVSGQSSAPTHDERRLTVPSRPEGMLGHQVVGGHVWQVSHLVALVMQFFIRSVTCAILTLLSATPGQPSVKTRLPLLILSNSKSRLQDFGQELTLPPVTTSFHEGVPHRQIGLSKATEIPSRSPVRFQCGDYGLVMLMDDSGTMGIVTLLIIQIQRTTPPTPSRTGLLGRTLRPYALYR